MASSPAPDSRPTGTPSGAPNPSATPSWTLTQRASQFAQALIDRRTQESRLALIEELSLPDLGLDGVAYAQSIRTALTQRAGGIAISEPERVDLLAAFCQKMMTEHAGVACGKLQNMLANWVLQDDNPQVVTAGLRGLAAASNSYAVFVLNGYLSRADRLLELKLAGLEAIQNNFRSYESDWTLAQNGPAPDGTRGTSRVDEVRRLVSTLATIALTETQPELSQKATELLLLRPCPAAAVEAAQILPTLTSPVLQARALKLIQAGSLVQGSGTQNDGPSTACLRTAAVRYLRVESNSAAVHLYLEDAPPRVGVGIIDEAAIDLLRTSPKSGELVCAEKILRERISDSQVARRLRELVDNPFNLLSADAYGVMTDLFEAMPAAAPRSQDYSGEYHFRELVGRVVSWFGRLPWNARKVAQTASWFGDVERLPRLEYLQTTDGERAFAAAIAAAPRSENGREILARTIELKPEEGNFSRRLRAVHGAARTNSEALLKSLVDAAGRDELLDREIGSAIRGILENIGRNSPHRARRLVMDYVNGLNENGASGRAILLGLIVAADPKFLREYPLVRARASEFLREKSGTDTPALEHWCRELQRALAVVEAGYKVGAGTVAAL